MSSKFRRDSSGLPVWWLKSCAGTMFTIEKKSHSALTKTAIKFALFRDGECVGTYSSYRAARAAARKWGV